MDFVKLLYKFLTEAQKQGLASAFLSSFDSVLNQPTTVVCATVRTAQNAIQCDVAVEILLMEAKRVPNIKPLIILSRISGTSVLGRLRYATRMLRRSDNRPQNLRTRVYPPPFLISSKSRFPLSIRSETTQGWASSLLHLQFQLLDEFSSR